MRYWLAIAAAVLLASGTAFADPIYPPPPQARPDCPAGSTISGYPYTGAPLGDTGHCAIPVASGAINLGTVGQLGGYTGTGTISGITPGGDVSFISPNFTVTSLRGGNIAVPNLSGTLALIAAPQALTDKGIDCNNNTCVVRANLDLTGALAAANFPALTGDVTTSAGSLATTITPGAVASGKLAASLALPGSPTTTTPATPDNSTKIATTAYVQAQGYVIGGSSPTFASLSVSGLGGNGTRCVHVDNGGAFGLAAADCGTGGGGGPPTGSATGDLSGSYPSPTVASIRGANLGSTTAAAGNILIGDGSQWVSRAVAGDVMFTGAGVATATVQNGSITAPKLAAGAASSNIGSLGGVLAGSLPNPTLAPLAVTTTAIADGNITNAKLANQAGMSVKANPTGALAATQDAPVAGGLTFSGGNLVVADTGIAANSYTVGSSCLTFNSRGQLTDLQAGACAAGTNFLLLGIGSKLLIDVGSAFLVQ